jgi:hypothetical protein
MATYSPNVSNSSGSLRIIKFSAWFRHSSSDVTVLPDLCFFLVFSEDAGMGTAASAPSPEFCYFLRGFCRDNLKMRKHKPVT